MDFCNPGLTEIARMLMLLVQVRRFLLQVQLALDSLHQEALAIGRQLHGQGADRNMPEDRRRLILIRVVQLTQRAGQLQCALETVAPSTAVPVDEIDHLSKQVLPQAEALAQLLWQHWQQPEQQAAARFELAQAAATRCCAYLPCAQLGAQGGPAAGEGVGSKRCSGCRVAWYCGTDCSHADWRAGHIKVCRALAATRTQQQG
jgi:hypothetical protein